MPHFRCFVIFLLAAMFALSPSLSAEELEICLDRELSLSGDMVTVGELRQRCLSALQQRSDDQSDDALAGAATPVDERLIRERLVTDNPWVILPHRPNYIMLLSYNDSVNNAPYGEDSPPLSRTEVKFQISLKFPIVRQLFNDRTQLLFAYTNQAWWQLYDKEKSSPFRENNHEPELFVVTQTNLNLWGWRNSLAMFGINHQSNGLRVPESRSWNRLFATLVFEKENWLVSYRPWYRLPEESKGDPLDATGDDNPDITDYMGHGEFRLIKKDGGHVYSMMLRSNFNSNKGAVELAWSFPFTRKIRGYVQWFNGYGESLIDYNANTNRFGVGLAINDWL